MLTIAEISERLNIPEPTLRFYRDKFYKQIPGEGEGRKRRYHNEAIEIFATIADLMRQKVDSKEIEKMLAVAVERQPVAEKTENEQPHGLVGTVKPQSLLSVIEQQNIQLSELRYALEENNKMLENQNRKIDEMSSLLQELKNSQKIEDTNLLKKIWQKLKIRV